MNPGEQQVIALAVLGTYNMQPHGKAWQAQNCNIFRRLDGRLALIDPVIPERNVHRAIERSRAASPLQTHGGPENCARGNKIDNIELLEGWLSPV